MCLVLQCRIQVVEGRSWGGIVSSRGMCLADILAVFRSRNKASNGAVDVLESTSTLGQPRITMVAVYSRQSVLKVSAMHTTKNTEIVGQFRE